MIVFPNCKINLGLHILNKREDGFHNLETVFYPLPLKDALEIIRNEEQGAGEVVFRNSGNLIEGDTQNNLCVKAYHLLKKDFPTLPAIHMHLHKTIPMGAGLGGGSSNGAFTLKLLNEKFQLGLTTQQLIDYALHVGSDCPFFIINKACYATGRGELLETVNLDLSAYQFVIVNPGIHVNTGWAFANLSGRSRRPDSEQDVKTSGRLERPNLRAILQQPIHTWKDQLMNEFEEPVSKAHPEIANIKKQLYKAGAVYASMTGSGSTVFGVFEKETELRFPETYFRKVI